MTSCPRCQRSFEDGVRFCPADGAQVTCAMPDRNVGRVLMGQFELREIAGRGAMGTVYRAYQRTMDRTVAVKLLRPEIVKEPGVLRRFLREARAAARLQHPNIVTVHLVGETEEGVPYLVMENIDGVSLETICEVQGRQPLSRVIDFARQIALALTEAHSVGIVHRDLKPANILVTDRSRNPDLIKVLDFGIAKLVCNDADQSMLSIDGTIFGTPHYIAPEQASGGDLDHRADLYSLGCILFRLTTGVLPFEGTQTMQVVLKHLREPPPRPRAIDPSIPPDLEALILSCLAKRRGDRPADAEQVIAALDRIASAPGRAAHTAPVATAPPKPTARIAPPARPKSSRGVWLGALMAATIGTSVGVLAALARHPLAVPPALQAVPPPSSLALSATEAVPPPASASPEPSVGRTLPSPTPPLQPPAPPRPAPKPEHHVNPMARRAHVSHARSHHEPEPLPVTVVRPDPEPPAAVRPVPVANPPPQPPQASPGPAVAPSATPQPLPSPPPVRPSEPRPRDETALPAPPASDPTTVPLPAPPVP